MQNHLIIKRIIDEWDPMDLLEMGAPNNEYESEIQMIHLALKEEKSEGQLGINIQHIFVTMFYEDDVIYSRQKCIEIARKIIKEVEQS